MSAALWQTFTLYRALSSVISLSIRAWSPKPFSRISARSAASARAMPSPMPLVEPVTNATLPDSMMIFFPDALSMLGSVFGFRREIVSKRSAFGRDSVHGMPKQQANMRRSTDRTPANCARARAPWIGGRPSCAFRYEVVFCPPPSMGDRQIAVAKRMFAMAAGSHRNLGSLDSKVGQGVQCRRSVGVDERSEPTLSRPSWGRIRAPKAASRGVNADSAYDRDRSRAAGDYAQGHGAHGRALKGILPSLADNDVVCAQFLCFLENLLRGIPH